jgi:transposase-like protein
MRKNGSEATVACSSSRSASSNMLNIGIASGHSVGEWDKAQNEVLKELEKIADLWPGGFACPTCGAPRGVVLNSRPRLFECLDCGRQTSITAGTAMHRSKLPLTVWFWAAHLMATHSNGMSARQLADQLGVTDKTAWLLTQKLRRSMTNPNRDPLEGVVEVDQAEIPFRVGDTFLEPGNAGKILIAGAIEVIDRDSNTSKPRRKGVKYLGTRSGRLRLAIIADNTATSIEAFVRANVKPEATLISDGHASYPGLSGDYRRDPRIVGRMAAHIVLPWSHRAFALLKRWALVRITACAAARQYLSQ